MKSTFRWPPVAVPAAALAAPGTAWRRATMGAAGPPRCSFATRVENYARRTGFAAAKGGKPGTVAASLFWWRHG